MNQHLLTQNGTGLTHRILVFGAILLFAAMLAITAIAGFGTANADSGKAAVVINEFGCVILDGDGNMVRASKVHTVITNSENGNRVLKCSAKGVDNSTGKATHFDIGNTGYVCNAYGVITANWRNMVSKSGNSTLTCLVP